MHNQSTLFRLLGGLLFHAPHSDIAQSVLDAFADHDDDTLLLLASHARQTDREQLEQDYFQLLQGNGDMPCPPWGSAYLEKDNALFGASTMAFREFIRSKGLTCDTGMREPEDHIGLMFLLTSLLLEQGDLVGANQLLEQHLMPFAPEMLSAMQTKAETPFYQQLAEFSQAWLNYYCEEQCITITEHRNYWQQAK